MRRLPLLIFYLSAAALAAVFVGAGVAKLPLWSQAAATPFDSIAYDRPRNDLRKAEHALIRAASAHNPNAGWALARLALRHADQSLARRPANPHAWHVRALAHARVGDTAKALSDFRRSVSLGPWEETLAVARIDFALRYWESLTVTEQAATSDQILWIGPRRHAALHRLAAQSPQNAAIIVPARPCGASFAPWPAP